MPDITTEGGDASRVLWHSQPPWMTGVTVIVTDFGAMPEVGWKVSGTREYVPRIRSWWMRPDVPEIVAALEEAYDGAERLAEDAREHALRYDADAVTETYLLPALAQATQPTAAFA